MYIKSFEFRDLKTNWHLEKTAFDPFNLLVGVSGVGKTKILDALRKVCRLATESDFNPGMMAWSIEVEHEGETYRWTGETREAKGEGLLEEIAAGKDTGEIACEKLQRGDALIVERDEKAFKFNGTGIPRPKKSISAVALYAEEDSVSPINRAFRRVVFSVADRAKPIITPAESIELFDRELTEFRQEFAKSNTPKTAESFTALREHFAREVHRIFGLPGILAYILQEVLPEEFDRIKNLFIDIFPSVKDVRVSISEVVVGAPHKTIQLTILEEGTDAWIPQSEISSGMLRTLNHLFEISFAPPGSVMVVDEFENSLGVNCMPELTRFIMSRADCQFILTSHHPYVINNIPTEAWKLVTRKGSDVQVKSARDIPALQGLSHQKAFIRLINLPEYEEGIS